MVNDLLLVEFVILGLQIIIITALCQAKHGKNHLLNLSNKHASIQTINEQMAEAE